ncbi:MAG: hypothetical protein KatS3mg014_0962 [Actinomycetota bacterium]|nr:MAG: hypothetical protein KatS3mg014_0962 [Actinomycetota bacterium]
MWPGARAPLPLGGRGTDGRADQERPGPAPAAIPSLPSRIAAIIGARRAAERRTGQLADALAAIASGMRTGLSLARAIEVAADGSSEPLGAELRAVVDRVRLGAPLEEALGRWVEAAPAPEVRLAVGVLRMHRAVGGAVAPALENLARTLRERRVAARELRSLTAQARLSGWVLGLLPLGFFVFLSVTARRDVLLALGTPLGRSAVLVGLILDLVAFGWIRRLLRVDA